LAWGGEQPYEEERKQEAHGRSGRKAIGLLLSTYGEELAYGLGASCNCANALLDKAKSANNR
jgi:hypothetical protein